MQLHWIAEKEKGRPHKGVIEQGGNDSKNSIIVVSFPTNTTAAYLPTTTARKGWGHARVPSDAMFGMEAVSCTEHLAGIKCIPLSITIADPILI